MKTPTNLKKFVADNKNRTFYYAHLWYGHGSVIELSPLRPSTSSSIVWSSQNRDYHCRVLGFASVYETREEASLEVELYELACSKFQHTPLIAPSVLQTHLPDLLRIENTIALGLSNHPDFGGTEFVETYDKQIQVRTFHKRVHGLCINETVFLKPDLSNADEVVAFLIEDFKRKDNPDTVSYANHFIEDGERYGFD